MTIKTRPTWPPLLAPTFLCAVLVGCGGSTAPANPVIPVTPVAPAGGPPAGSYSCLLLTLMYLPPDFYPSPTYEPSAPGTEIIGPGNSYSALSYPGSGTYSFNAAGGWVTFRGGPFDKVNAAFERLEGGTPTLHFEEKLGDPSPDVQIGDSVCYG